MGALCIRSMARAYGKNFSGVKTPEEKNKKGRLMSELKLRPPRGALLQGLAKAADFYHQRWGARAPQHEPR